MAATMSDVARLAGVSAKTVSNVINDHPYVRHETRERVERAISQLDYTLNLAARSLRSGRSGVIGLAVPALSVAYFAELAEGVIAAAEPHDLAVLVERTGTVERERAFLRSARLQHMDGLILNPMDDASAGGRSLALPIPMVLLGERVLGRPTDHVTIDQVGAARTATSHLLALGRRRIAAIGAHDGGEDDSVARMRLVGYRAALLEHDIVYDANLVVQADLWHRSNGAIATRELLQRKVAFDAIFAFNDTLALGAMRVLQEAGLRVPDDVAVVGFDNLDESAYSIPSLTTVDTGRAEIARSAVQLLVDRIAGASEPRLRVTAHTLVTRESSGG
ncbi:MAG: LacI family transcriptional regulator [Phycicoccus sp.]|nr:LacI family transcriptional regulator [Cellulomonas sp.]NMM24406.1 LacI family transcriptional regulator [Phycicoccus sp.]